MARWPVTRILTCVPPTSMTSIFLGLSKISPSQRAILAHLRLERIVDSAEDGAAVAAETDINVADDEGTRDAADTDADHPVQVHERIRAGVRPDAPHIHEGRDLHIDVRRKRID